MKKKIFMGLFALALLVTAGFGVSKSMENNVKLSYLALANVEALAETESSSCYSGGLGSNQCSIDAGIDIVGSGVTAGCSVSCNSGYYSCCSLRCTCIRNNG